MDVGRNVGQGLRVLGFVATAAGGLGVASVVVGLVRSEGSASLLGPTLPSGIGVGVAYGIVVAVGAGLAWAGNHAAGELDGTAPAAFSLILSVVIVFAGYAGVRHVLGSAPITALRPSFGCVPMLSAQPLLTTTGQTVVLYGRCFPATSAVTLSVDGHPVTGSWTVDAQGSVEVRLVLKAGSIQAVPGAHDAKVQDSGADGGYATAQFHVVDHHGPGGGNHPPSGIFPPGN